jgi:hypothetical protein
MKVLFTISLIYLLIGAILTGLIVRHTACFSQIIFDILFWPIWVLNYPF